jgi:hypothetical protein
MRCESCTTLHLNPRATHIQIRLGLHGCYIYMADLDSHHETQDDAGTASLRAYHGEFNGFGAYSEDVTERAQRRA